MITIQYFHVDVFTDKQFGGNQLAVIPNALNLSDELMQKIAREFNFSETTFVLPPEKPESDCKVRIFTPENEMPTAGHPTIGTSFVLLSERLLQPKVPGVLLMEQKIGDIKVSYQMLENSIHSITMRQPLPEFGPIFNDTKLIAEILSVSQHEIDPRYPVQSVSCGNNFLFIPVKSIEILKKVKIRADLLELHKTRLDSTEFYIFSLETLQKKAATHGRMFAPMFGIWEDPATGSASGPLGCYLVKHGISNGKNIICEQGYEMGRPSIINVDIEHINHKITEIKVGGTCVFVAQGNLNIEN
ncbi:MAG: PhzF family phenazine biosynthesis protein [Bacteroidales bacterium]|nr:PhzF family phenazine biosynthesis protein [Bacteroidales bacterium]